MQLWSYNHGLRKLESGAYPPRYGPCRHPREGITAMTTEKERARKLALLQRWEQMRELYDTMVLKKQNEDLKAERDAIWLQLSEETMVEMIGTLSTKIQDFSGEYKNETKDMEKSEDQTAQSRQDTASQNTEKNQSWGPYQ